MKKIFCVIVLLSCFLGSCLAQETIEYCSTYCYIKGVKTKVEKPRFLCITFMDDYTKFYHSDEYGNCTSYNKDNTRQIYEYLRTESDYHVYRRVFHSTENSSTVTGRLNYGYDKIIYGVFSLEQKFSKDLSLWNMPVPNGSNNPNMIFVYKRVSKAGKEAILREYEESLPTLLR